MKRCSRCVATTRHVSTHCCSGTAGPAWCWSAGKAAGLEDRIRFNEDRPQRYGTVLDWNAAGELGCEVEDPAGLDARRAAVGLPPFREALEQQRREIHREGGGPPADNADYRRRARSWAKGAGC